MSAQRKWLKDQLAAHPIVDHLAPIATTLALYLAPMELPSATARHSYYSGVAVVAGLALAAATFICTMTYQSSNILMSEVRQRFATQLKRNWTSIIVSAALAATVAVLMHLLDTATPSVAVGIASYGLVLVVARIVRSVWWLRYTLFMAETSSRVPAKVRLPAPEKIV